MADDPATTSSAAGATTEGATAEGTTAENAALQQALAAEHIAIWGYGTVGAAVAESDRADVEDAENAHRDVREEVTALLAGRGADPVAAAGGYALPFPVDSADDAAKLAVTLEAGITTAWVYVLDQATEASTRILAVTVLGAAEVRAVGWRKTAGTTPVTSAFPGLSGT